MEQLLLDFPDRVEPTRGHPRQDFWREPEVLVRGVRSVAAMMMRAWLHVYDRLTIVGYGMLLRLLPRCSSWVVRSPPRAAARLCGT